MTVAVILAFRTLDCGHKLRIHYELPRPVAVEALAGELPDAELRIDEFSKAVRGAHDHFSIRIREDFLSSGTVGATRLTATFRKSDGQTAIPVEFFEATLSKLLACPVHVQVTRKAAA